MTQQFHSRELEKHTQVKTCIQMFIRGLFIRVKKWKQPKCSSAHECINKRGRVLNNETSVHLSQTTFPSTKAHGQVYCIEL